MNTTINFDCDGPGLRLQESEHEALDYEKRKSLVTADQLFDVPYRKMQNSKFIYKATGAKGSRVQGSPLALLFVGLAKRALFSPALNVSFMPSVILSPAALSGPRLSRPRRVHLRWLALLFVGLAKQALFSPTLGGSLMPSAIFSPAALCGPRLSRPWRIHLRWFGTSGGRVFP